MARIFGTPEDDDNFQWVQGTAEDDEIFALTGDDTIRGSAGNDMLDGGPGDDVAYYLDIGTSVMFDPANDRVIKGNGTDQLTRIETVVLPDGGKVISLNPKYEVSGPGDVLSIETISLTDATENLIVDLTEGIARYEGARAMRLNWFNHVEGGLSVENRLTGTIRDNIITGGNRDDRISGEAGDDLLKGLGGDDKIQGGEGADKISGGNGSDDIEAGEENDEVSGGAGNDKINGEAGDDVLVGGTGNDQIWGGFDNDELLGGAGDDKLIGQFGRNVIYGGTGNDDLFTLSSTSTALVRPEYAGGELYGGRGNDKLTGSNQRNEMLDGGQGNDIIKGGGQGSTRIGGQGDDRITGAGFGGKGDDRINANFGKSYGGSGDDTLTIANKATGYGQGGDDRFILGWDGAGYGGAGNDTFEITIRTKTLIADGGGGRDTASVETIRDLYLLSEGDEDTPDGESYLRGFETVSIISTTEDTVFIRSDRANVSFGEGPMIADLEAEKVRLKALSGPMELTARDSQGSVARLGAADDTVELTDAQIKLFTGGGEDRVTLAGAATVHMGAGDDKLTLRRLTEPSEAQVTMGDGDDQVVLKDSLTSLDLGNGSDLVRIEAGVEEARIVTGSGADVIRIVDSPDPSALRIDDFNPEKDSISWSQVSALANLDGLSDTSDGVRLTKSVGGGDLEILLTGLTTADLTDSIFV